MGISRRQGFYVNCDDCDHELVYENEHSRAQVAERLWADGWISKGTMWPIYWYCSEACAIKGEAKREESQVQS